MHLSITFPEDLKRELDREAKKQSIGRSTLIQKAVRVYLELKRRNEEKYLLREGYQEMYGEMAALQKEFENLDQDSLKYVD